MTKKLGVGLDIGTMNLVAARMSAGGKTETSRMRDMFLDLPVEAKKRLKLAKLDFVDRDEDLLLLGDAAMHTANLFGKEVRRPLSAGLVSPGEIDSIEVLGYMIKALLGDPREDNEICYYSIPAAPVDQDRDVIYHKGVFRRILEECGYDGVDSNEAMAIIFSETADEGFSGIAISFGSGMTNVALSIQGIEGMSFSVARGGDWIDSGAAKSVGSTSPRICSVKEDGMDLTAPQGREQEAIAFYYEELIRYTLDLISQQFIANRAKFSMPDAIPMIVSGGTSMVGGFMPFFEKTFARKKRRFPIKIKEIRQAKDPLSAVAQGLLIQALQEYEED